MARCLKIILQLSGHPVDVRDKEAVFDIEDIRLNTGWRRRWV